jgi:crotonobetaine/carnitine-CoA ligase
MLEKGARDRPNARCLLVDDGTDWNFLEVLQKTREWAAGLQQLGVKPGDRVSVWLPNGWQQIIAWYAANYLGAIYAPINIAFRGDLLQHVVDTTDSELLIVHHKLIPFLEAVDIASVAHIVCIGDPAKGPATPCYLPATTLDGDSASLGKLAEVHPWDTQAILYTSGTTGPSKAVKLSYMHVHNNGSVACGFVKAGECALVNMPLFHIGACGTVMAALSRQAAVSVHEVFNPREFWAQVRLSNSTVCCGMVGSMLPFLLQMTKDETNFSTPMRRLIVAPVHDDVRRLAQQYDFEFFSGYGTTEVPCPLVTEVNFEGKKAGYCGRPRTGMECRIVDENDLELASDQVGELVVRSEFPWEISTGYFGMPEATAKVWQNGWFHTGDAFCRDEEGDFYFVDRLKDAIRRRGENISSFEVEIGLLSHPVVTDCAVIGIKTNHGDEDILAVVERSPESKVNYKELIEHCSSRMAHFMVPRYIRVIDHIPRTPTNKVMKMKLREDGITEDTWDREADGIIIKRTRL